MSTADVCRKHALDADGLQVQDKVRRHDGVRRPRASNAGGREREAKTASDRDDAEQLRAEGFRHKNL